MSAAYTLRGGSMLGRRLGPMTAGWALAVSAGVTMGWAAAARAEGTPLAPEGETAGGGGAGGPVTEEPGEGQRAAGRGIDYGAHIVVAVPLHGVFADVLGTGIGVHGRIGWELPGGLSLEATLGYLFISVADYEAGGVDS